MGTNEYVTLNGVINEVSYYIVEKTMRKALVEFKLFKEGVNQ